MISEFYDFLQLVSTSSKFEDGPFYDEYPHFSTSCRFIKHYINETYSLSNKNILNFCNNFIASLYVIFNCRFQ